VSDDAAHRAFHGRFKLLAAQDEHTVRCTARGLRGLFRDLPPCHVGSGRQRNHAADGAVPRREGPGAGDKAATPSKSRG